MLYISSTPPPIQLNQPIQRKLDAPPKPPLPPLLSPPAPPRTLEPHRGTVQQTPPGPTGNRTRPPLPSWRILPIQRLRDSTGTSSRLRARRRPSLLHAFRPSSLRLLLSLSKLWPRPLLQVRRPAKVLELVHLQTSRSMVRTRPQKTAPSIKENQ